MEKKDDYIRFRLSSSLRKEIEAAALNECDGNVSKYILQLHEKAAPSQSRPPISKANKELHNLLSRIGNNLNQIARDINILVKAEKGMSEAKAKEMMKELYFISSVLSNKL
jgi:hypothetical protein